LRALRFDQSQLTLDSKAAEPALTPAHALIRPTRIGLHPIDIAVARGWTTYSGTLGRECIGLVESVGGTPEDIARWTGKRVLLQSTLSCGTCPHCRSGASAHCPERRIAGLSGRDGFCADRLCVPINSLIEVPKTIGEDLAIFAYGLADAAHTAQVVRTEGKTYITVLGDTLDALLVARVLTARNTTVRLLCRNRSSLTTCEKWGIRARPISEAGLRHDQSIVVDCSDSPSSLDHAISMLRPRGTLILRSPLAAIPARLCNPQSPPPQSTLPTAAIIAKELNIIGARASTLAEGLDLVSKTGTDLLPLITRRFKLADGVNAVKTAADPAHLKVIIEP
jgi:alcohol dehydrogenase